MSRTPQASERKNRFQISREVQEDFVNSVAENMLALAQSAGKWEKPWQTQGGLGMPFCATTGREYSGANMVKLLLTSITNSYADDRWMTFKQLQKFQEAHPDLTLQIRKGEKGTKILRPEEISFTIDEDGKWDYLTPKQVKELQEQKEQGFDVPDINRLTLFYPFTVFNGSQIDGFPQKEQPAVAMTSVERNEFVEHFIASSGVAVRHHNGGAYYSDATDSISMPYPQNFTQSDEYYAAKLHEFYHATGHKDRENRKDAQTMNGKSYALEEVRAEMFSMLAGARFDLPMPEQNSAAYIDYWNQKFSGGDAKAVFQAASESAKILTIMHQYEMGEQPRAKWFPLQEAWPDLIAMQAERDIANGVTMIGPPAMEASNPEQDHSPTPRPPLPSFEEAKQNFQQAENPITQFRAILQNPKLLEMALQMDRPDDNEAARSIASICDSLAQTIHMELDAQQASAPRMRL